MQWHNFNKMSVRGKAKADKAAGTFDIIVSRIIEDEYLLQQIDNYEKTELI